MDYALKRRKKTLKRIYKIFGDTIDYSNAYDLNKRVNEDSVEFKCKIHNMIFFRPLGLLAKGHTGCPECKKINFIKRTTASRLGTEEFIRRAREIHGNKYNYDKVNYVTNAVPVIITCPIHGDWKAIPANHISKNSKLSTGCPKCGLITNGDSHRKSTEYFIKKAREIHGDKYDYSKVNYRKYTIPVEIICPEHGSFYQTPDIHYKGSGCPICSASKGELAIERVLNKQNIVYIKQFKFNNFNFRYDFCLPELKILIEYHGEQHYGPVTYFGGLDKHKLIIEADISKEQLALANGYYLLVVPYDGYTSLEKYLLSKISLWYRYRIKNKFFKNFLEIAKFLKLKDDATYQDVLKYRTFLPTQ